MYIHIIEALVSLLILSGLLAIYRWCKKMLKKEKPKDYDVDATFKITCQTYMQETCKYYKAMDKENNLNYCRFGLYGRECSNIHIEAIEIKKIKG